MRPIHLLLSCSLASLLGTAGIGAAENAAATAQLAQLRAAVPDLRARIDPASGLARHLACPHGALLTVGPLRPAAVGKVAGVAPVLAFLDAYPELCGGGSAMLAEAEVQRDSLSPLSGLRTVVWQQVVAGLPVHQALLQAHLDGAGELIAIGSRFVPSGALAPQRAAHAGVAGAAHGDAGAALSAALRAVGDAAPQGAAAVLAPPTGAQARHRLAHARLRGSAEARLVWFATPQATLELAWAVTFTARQDGRMYEVLVGVADGAVRTSRCLTVEDPLPHAARRAPAPRAGAAPLAPAPAAPLTSAPLAATTTAVPASAATTVSYRVFTSDSPTPFSPAYPTPSSTHAQPPQVARTLVTLASLDPLASPLGWMGASGDTTGNNVDAHTDLDNDDLPDLPRPQSSGSPPTFDFPCDLTQEPATYRSAAVVNLFYWCNLVHDRYYGLGFTEAAGNFQNDNLGRGGLGNDAVTADAQDGGGTDNANFSTPPDGSPGRMQMYLGDGVVPGRDGDLDATVIIHEYTHGLSNRLVGGGVGISSLQPSGMGEGWSDFYALCLLSSPGDDVHGTYPVGSYLFDGLTADNYYTGIRRYPYVSETGPVTAASKNPLTLGDIRINSEVHEMGEVWCETLWEARANLIARHGAAAGNQRILQLVTDGMKLSPPNPTFLEARDAILQADQAAGGDDQAVLWQAFAKRGLGFSAQSSSADVVSDVVEAFDVPGDLRLSSAGGLVASGAPGGPFSPASVAYVVRNAGTATLAWTAVADQPWISVSPTGGTLAPNAAVTVTVALGAASAALVDGSYSGAVTFTNVTTHSGDQARAVSVRVSSSYTVKMVPGAWIDPSGHTDLALTDDSVSAPQALPFPVVFYGKPYTSVMVGSNGMLGFGAADGLYTYINSALPSADAPNATIYAAWDDLNPSAGGSVRFAITGTAPNRKAVASWVGVPRFADAATLYTMQVVLSEGSRDILVNYLQVSPDSPNGAGASATVGIENETGDLAQQFSFDTASLVNGQALLYHVPSGTGLQGAYYANETLVGPPALLRTDALVDFDFGAGSPGAGIPADRFSARWTGALEPRADQALTLIARSDDGVRVYLDGQLVINNWTLHSPADSTYTFAAVAGRKYGIRMEYYEHTGGAVAQLLWSSATIVRQPVPTSQLYPVLIGNGTGLVGGYFANQTLAGSPAVTRDDALVDFDWGAGAPVAGVPADHFSVRWTGALEPQVSEALTLIARTDDGVRMWLDNVLVIDKWTVHGVADSTYTFAAEAGRKYALRVEYFENAGLAVAQLDWRSASIPRQPIPTSQLYLATPALGWERPRLLGEPPVVFASEMPRP